MMLAVFFVMAIESEAHTGSSDPLPAPTQDNLEVMADMSEREDARIDPLRGLIETISSFFGTPRYFVAALLFIAVWITLNLWGREHGWRYVDPPPFFWLQGIVSSNALLLTISVLIRQDRMAQLAEQRAHLDLQINMLTERKATKALQLLAALQAKQSTPEDQELVELLQPADAKAIMGAIRRKDGAAD